MAIIIDIWRRANEKGKETKCLKKITYFEVRKKKYILLLLFRKLMIGNNVRNAMKNAW